MARYFFDVYTSDGRVERDETGVFAPDIGSVLYGCIGAILEVVEDSEEDVEQVTIRGESGDLLLIVNVKALRAISAQDE